MSGRGTARAGAHARHPVGGPSRSGHVADGAGAPRGAPAVPGGICHTRSDPSGAVFPLGTRYTWRTGKTARPPKDLRPPGRPDVWPCFPPTDVTFITSTAFAWKVSAVTLLSCLPLYVVKYLKRKLSPPSYSKLMS